MELFRGKQKLMTSFSSVCNESSITPRLVNDEILEGPGFGCGLEKRVEIERDVSQKEDRARLGVGRHALEVGQERCRL